MRERMKRERMVTVVVRFLRALQSNRQSYVVVISRGAIMRARSLVFFSLLKLRFVRTRVRSYITVNKKVLGFTVSAVFCSRHRAYQDERFPVRNWSLVIRESAGNFVRLI